jgi:hypothetical protein
MTLPQRLTDLLGGGYTGREVAIGRRQPPARVARAVDYASAVEHGRGIVRAAQVRALEYVAEEALQATGRLSQSEVFWTRHCPHGAARFQAIADLAAMGMANIVSDMGRE